MIVEGLLGIVFIGSGQSLGSDIKIIGLAIAGSAFLLVVIIVALMVWLIPENLTYGSYDWAKKAEREKNYADSNNPVSKQEVEKLEPGETTPK